ncbi:MAG TPA: PrsW family glutamic-type intramembrane protease [Ktedonosporobacter sp.]|nr:PrsW family glutamic-type intramembrane protease [Ktedonosporobacter sp.]
MSQNYGVLRVVRVRPSADVAPDLQEKYPKGWLPEERLVHLLTHSETTIGRALSNDLILMDPAVSREHARLIHNEHGWQIVNLTTNNVVSVNGRAVAGGSSLPLHPQDFLVLGNTMLQLIAPQIETSDDAPDTKNAASHYTPLNGVVIQPSTPSNGTALNGSKHQLRSPGPKTGFLTPLPPTQLPAEPLMPFEDEGEDDALPPLSPQSELIAQPWENVEENLLGIGVTMQFALSRRIGTRTRWLIAGGGIALLLVCTIIIVLLSSVLGFAPYGTSNLLVALTVPVIPAFFIHLLVNFIDRYEREPWFLRLAAFLWGAIIAIPPAFLIEQNVGTFMDHIVGPNPLLNSIFRGLNAGITEETVKGLGLLLLFLVLRDEFDNITDGIVYGALIGAGFAMVENFVYFVQSPKELLPVLIVGRVVLGWLSHSTFTMCFGATLGYIRHTRVRWQQIVVPVVGYVCAVMLHSVFDFVNLFVTALVLQQPAGSTTIATFSLIAIIGDYIPPFITQIVLLYVLMRALAHEAGVIREFLASEVSDGVVNVDEYALLQNSFQRTREERRILRLKGVKQWLRVKALYQTEIGLAFRKWHVSMGDKPKLGYLQPEDAYRQRIKRLRQEIKVAEQKSS